VRAAVAIGPGQVELRDVPEPVISTPTDVLIRMVVAGVCHSDVDVVNGSLNQSGWPLIPGHEPMGVVSEVGVAVRTVQPGDRVVVNPLLTCGTCPRCLTGEATACERWFAAVDGYGTVGRVRAGAFAELLVVPESNVIPLPSEVPDEVGALLTDAGAVSFHALRRARPRAGDTVAVIGLGGLGRCAVSYLATMPAVRVVAIDRDPEKVNWALMRGAAHGVVADARAPETVRDLTHGHGVDIAIEHSGSAAGATLGFDVLRLRGTLVTTTAGPVNLELPIARLSLGEYTILGAHAALRPDIENALGLVARGVVNLDGIVTHRLNLSQLPEALDALTGDVDLPVGPIGRITINNFSG